MLGWLAKYFDKRREDMWAEVYKSTRNKQWYVRVVNRNGNKIVRTEGYKNKADAISIANSLSQGFKGVKVLD